MDAGFACYRDELWRVLREEIPDFDLKRKELLLTHSDVDHVGYAELFDKIYLSPQAYEDFFFQDGNEPGWREENPLHMPYVKITKLLSSYQTPPLEKCVCIGESADYEHKLLVKIDEIRFHDLNFEIYAGSGGHVKGEIIAIERNEHIIFTGDIFVNIKGFTTDQAKDNKLAPYLMTSVDTNPSIARRERVAFLSLLDEGKWKIFCGHGAMYEYIK